MKRTSQVILASSLLFFAIPHIIYGGWIKTYGGQHSDQGYWVEQTSDGGYIVAGRLEISPAPDRVDRVYLIKTDSIGDTLWTRSYGGEDIMGLNNSGRCVQETSDGGYILIGSKGLSALPWLFKFDINGDTLWTRTYDANWCYCVRETLDGGFIITGTASKHLWLLKTDSLGDSLWARTYGEEDGQGGYSLELTPDGGYIVTGFNRGALWLLKTDSLGDTLWTRSYEYGDAELSEQGHCVQPTSDGGYVVSGVADYFVMQGQGDLWLLKTDSLGDTLWTRTYGREGIDRGNSVRETLDGGYIIAGEKGDTPTSTGALWLLKTDLTGDTLWTRIFGGTSGDDRGDCVQLTSDGGYIVTGFTSSFSPDGSNDVLLLKTDSLGNAIVEESVGQLSRMEIISPVGEKITLSYTDHPQGFHALIYDASGRRVKEIHSDQSSGTITWPVTHQSSGVYFIKERGTSSIHKVVLIR